jgi:acyl-CoA thioester hydrolase
MERVKIPMPLQYNFSCQIPIRITDINYGSHVGNAVFLELLHEARMQYLTSLGYTELQLDGVGLLMVDAAIEFKQQLFYGDAITVQLTAANLSRVGFVFYYQITTTKNNTTTIVCNAKTSMVCYNYALNKAAPVPLAAIAKLQLT